MEEKDNRTASQTAAEEETKQEGASSASEENAGTTGSKEAAPEKDRAKEGEASQAEKQEEAGAGETADKAAEENAGAGKAQEEASQNSSSEQEASENSPKGRKPDAKDQKIEELTDKYKRLFAEFDNYRKRTDAEKSGMYAEGQRSILEKILPVLDNFERASLNVPEDLKGSAYVEGVEKVSRAAMDTLKALGVEPIEALGQSFDANLHNAVMHIEDEEHGENEIVEEFQKGYKYKDKVLRYSMVKVAN